MNPEYGKGSCSEGSSVCSNEMMIIRWNVRGVKMVKQLKMSTNNKYKPAIFALVQTMVTDKSCGIARLSPYFHFLANYETNHDGRIWEFQHPSLLLLVFTKAAS